MNDGLDSLRKLLVLTPPKPKLPKWFWKNPTGRRVGPQVNTLEQAQKWMTNHMNKLPRGTYTLWKHEYGTGFDELRSREVLQ